MNNLINRKELLNRTIKNLLHSPYITKQDVLNCPPAQSECEDTMSKEAVLDETH